MEERCCPNRVARHDDEKLLAPGGHARALGHDDRLAPEEVRHVVEVQLDAQLASSQQRARWPGDVAASLRAFQTAGVQHLTVVLDPWTVEGIEQFGAVIRLLRG